MIDDNMRLAMLRTALEDAVNCMNSMMERFLDADVLRMETKKDYRFVIERCKNTLKETRR